MEKSGQTPVIMWEIVQKYSPYNPNSKICYLLCLNEKLETVTYRGNCLLNKKTELISKCRHQTNARFPSMLYMIDVSCIVRNHYIVTLLG